MVGAWLRSPSRRRGDKSAAATFLGVTERTLTRWRKEAKPRKNGRPATNPQVQVVAKPRILEILGLLGFGTGKRTVKEKLPDLSYRVIEAVLRVLKAENKARNARRLKRQRVHTAVIVKGAVETQDSTHTGNVENTKAWAEVAKDCGTTEARAFGDGKPLNGEAMVGHLEDRKKTGTLPLVLGIDNGPGNRDTRVIEWAAKEQLILLFNRPHTPTDNAPAERGIGEGKGLAGLGKGVKLKKAVQGVQELDKALQVLNQHWPRVSRGGLTAVQLKQTLPHWQSKTSRSRFYSATTRAIKRATKGLEGRALRRETRNAIFRTLERFGLILRWRGELRQTAKFQDKVS